MSPRTGATLYTPEVLALAVELADYPMSEAFILRGQAASRVCGSRATVGVAANEDGSIERIGAQMTACAIGQAAAALFLRSACGRDEAEVSAGLAAIDDWLKGEAPLPDWPGITMLDPARAYLARHPAILLPWKAALAALSNRLGAD